MQAKRRTIQTIKENHMFSKVFKNGRFASTEFLTVYALKNYNRNAASKLGVSASPKIGGAVQRNRAKRVIRESYRELNGRIPSGWLIVVMARKPCFDRCNKTPEVHRSLEFALAKLGLLNN